MSFTALLLQIYPPSLYVLLRAMNLVLFSHLKGGASSRFRLHTLIYILDLDQIYQHDLSTVATDLVKYLYYQNNFADRANFPKFYKTH